MKEVIPNNFSGGEGMTSESGSGFNPENLSYLELQEKIARLERELAAKDAEIVGLRNELAQGEIAIREVAAILDKKIEIANKEVEKVIEISNIDPLTGCENLKSLNEHIVKFYNPERDSRRGDTCVVFGDINGLKQVNDSLGHDAGNELIRTVGNVFKENFRKSDSVFRIGGDEFIILCNNDDKDGNFEENIRHKLEAIEYSLGDMKPPISVAFGVAMYDSMLHDGKVDADIHSTIKRADEEMYRDKNKTQH